MNIRPQGTKIGIDLVVQEVERSLAIRRTAANEQQLSAWNNDGSEPLFTFPRHVFPYEVADLATSGPLYARWFQSAGTQGTACTNGARPFSYTMLAKVACHTSLTCRGYRGRTSLTHGPTEQRPFAIALL